jgi:hypothetical protein
MDILRKLLKLNRITLIICFLSISFVWSGCNRKVGVKPNGHQKTSTGKCKCKKKVGIYSSNSIHKLFYFSDIKGSSKGDYKFVYLK